jgi:hypothetical protein
MSRATIAITYFERLRKLGASKKLSDSVLRAATMAPRATPRFTYGAKPRRAASRSFGEHMTTEQTRAIAFE